jgi:hypothetical protein
MGFARGDAEISARERSRAGRVADPLEAEKHAARVGSRRDDAQPLPLLALQPEQRRAGGESLREIGADGDGDLARNAMRALDAPDDEQLRGRQLSPGRG